MRANNTVLTAVVLLAAVPAFGQPMGGDMKNMPRMSHAAPAAKTGQGTGVITAIDAKANKLTIQHGPIPAVGWPAMTMAFKANPPTLLHGLRVGQRIRFDVKVQGAAAEVTGIRVQ